MRYALLLAVLVGCDGATEPTAPLLFGNYSIHNFADSHCRSVVYFTFSSRDTSVTGFGAMVPSDSLVERLPMGRYRSQLFVQVYERGYERIEPVYEYSVDDSVDVPGTRTLGHCLLGVPTAQAGG